MQTKKFSQIDRILAHGGQGSWTEKSKRLARYQGAATPEIALIAGGGLNLSVMEMIHSALPVTEFHFGTAARVDGKGSRLCVSRLASLIHQQSIDS